MALLGRAGCAHEGDHVVGAVGETRPHFAACDAPAAIDFVGARADAGEVGPGVGFAHADGEVALAGGDTRQNFAFRPRAAVAQDLRPRLALGHPMAHDGGARRQQFLDDDVALERGAFLAAELFGPGHAEQASGATFGAERFIGFDHGADGWLEAAIRAFLGAEGADLGPEARGLRRHGHGLEVEMAHRSSGSLQVAFLSEYDGAVVGGKQISWR